MGRSSWAPTAQSHSHAGTHRCSMEERRHVWCHVKHSLRVPDAPSAHVPRHPWAPGRGLPQRREVIAHRNGNEVRSRAVRW
jgi:hypothetical protein